MLRVLLFAFGRCISANALWLFVVMLFCNIARAQTTGFNAPGNQISGLAYDGTYLYASDNEGPRTIFVLDPKSGTVIRSFSGCTFGCEPNDMVFVGGGKLFISDINTSAYETDTQTGTVLFARINLPFRGNSLAFDGTNLYIQDFDSSRFLVTDLGGNVLQALNADERTAGWVFNPVTNDLWGTDQFGSNIFELSKAGTLVRTCAGPQAPPTQGLGAITIVNANFYIAQTVDPTTPGVIFVVNPYTLSCNPALALQVSIEIKPPASAPVPINLSSSGVIPVAILSTATFDATTVDPGTVSLAGGKVKLIGKSDKYSCSIQDVNGDGLPDLLCQVSTAQFMIEAGQSTGTLEAQTFSGQHIIGQETIQIVPQ